MILHYLSCAFLLTKKYILIIPLKLKHLLLKTICLIKCFFIVNKPVNENYLKKELQSFWPNKCTLASANTNYSNECIYYLSIIIPAYNAEQYIENCIKSVLNQNTNYLYEVIIINDGSSDNTQEILEKYRFNTSIKIIHQCNMGQSVSRNHAIDISSGRYIMFVDADDILMPNAIQKLLHSAIKHDCDIVEGSFVRFYDGINEEMIRESKGNNHIESNIMHSKLILTSYGYSWAKIYKRELWTTLRFPVGCIFEDVITKFILRRKAKKIAFIEDVVYGYRQNNQSSSHGSNQLKKLDSIWVLPKIFELCNRENIPRDDIFYLLSLNHIGLLNYITTLSLNIDIKLACFYEMKKQLLSIQDCRPKRMPIMFKLLDKAIIENRFEAWQYISRTIIKYNMLKKWREIN